MRGTQRTFVDIEGVFKGKRKKKKKKVMKVVEAANAKSRERKI